MELDVSEGALDSSYQLISGSNNFPHSTFNWVGLDGSQLLTHMTPVDTYGSQYVSSPLSALVDTTRCDIGDIYKGMAGHKNLDVTGQSSPIICRAS